MPKRTRDYHEFLLEQLIDPVFAADYLNEARQDSQKMFLKALRNVAESRRMAVLAEQTGLNRESLYKSLSEDGNPRLETYDSVLSALGIDYEFKPKEARSAPPEPAEPVRVQAQTANASLVDPAQKFATWTTTNVFANLAANAKTMSIADTLIGEQIPDIPLYMLPARISQRQEANQE